MDYIWVAVAFICGFLVKQIGLPPLVGYLAAGFGLHALGFIPDASLDVLADLGVALLLFTIGLKLKIKSLFKTEIWASASGSMSVIMLLATLNGIFLSAISFSHFVGMDWVSAAIVGFSISFSSTVCAVKVLEDKGEMKARHGQIAIGILIIQDIAAVIFVTFAEGETPSLWALTLFLLPLLRPSLSKILEHSGHGELLPLMGFFLAFTGSMLFGLVGLEEHLGALVFGILLSGQKKAVELAKSLLDFKDLFLIGFFLSIGFTALPTIDMFGIALLLTIALPIKTGIIFLSLTQLKLRSRTAFLTSLSLSNYSEFGLIVCAVSVEHGLLPEEWLVIMALAVALSFIFSSIVNLKAHDLYLRWRRVITRFEKPERLNEDQFSQPKNATVLVIGMGRVGTGTYDTLRNELQKDVCGVDVDRDRVTSHLSLGRNVIMADAEDPEFWSHINLSPIHLIMFAMPNYLDIMEAAKQIKLAGFRGKTAGIARYDDEKEKMIADGIDVVFNYYAKVGTGFAEESIHLFDAHHEEI